MTFEWESLSRFGDWREGKANDRARVHGGWIVRSMDWSIEYHIQSESMVFISDPNHEWTIEDK